MLDPERAIQALMLEWEQWGANFEMESAIQICEFLGEYQRGLDIYHLLSSRHALDERWVGQCLVALGERERAREHYFRSIEMGLEAAAIDLAFTTSLLGQGEKAIEELNTINKNKLSKYNLALWNRTMGFIHLCHYNKKVGLEYLYESWKVIQNADEFQFIAPKILVLLSNAEKEIGNKNKSLYYISRAEEICKTKLRRNIVYIKSTLLYEEGKIEDARRGFLELMKISEDGVYLAVSYEYLARISFIEGDYKAAMDLYENCIDYSEKLMITSMACFASSFLACLFASLDNKVKAFYYLNLARSTATSDDHLRDIELREMYIQSIFNPLESNQIDRCQQVMIYYFEKNNAIEYVRARIYYCYFLLKFKVYNYEKEIEDFVYYLINNNYRFLVYEEWKLLNNLLEYVNWKFDSILTLNCNKDITINVIDKEEIKIDGKIVSVPLRKSIEVLFYIYIHGHCALKSIISDIFQESDYQKAKTYFHQIKFQISEKVEGMGIEYDKNSRTYFLKIESGYQIKTDLGKVLQGQEKLEGIILPSSGSDWVIELNQRLSE